MKISTIILILVVLLSIILAILSYQPIPNETIIKIFGDALKGLIGALVGAFAGEKNE